MTKIQTIGLVILGIIVSVIFSASSNHNLGGVYSQVLQDFSSGIKVGSTGNNITQVNHGTCNLAALSSEYPTIMNASSTAIFTCAATGAAVGDKVFLMQGLYPSGSATTTIPGINGGVAGIRFKSALVTAADTISVELVNLTGAATSSFVQATSTWSWMTVR